jgi:hypothetical protein
MKDTPLNLNTFDKEPSIFLIFFLNLISDGPVGPGPPVGPLAPSLPSGPCGP